MDSGYEADSSDNDEKSRNSRPKKHQSNPVVHLFGSANQEAAGNAAVNNANSSNISNPIGNDSTKIGTKRKYSCCKNDEAEGNGMNDDDDNDKNPKKPRFVTNFLFSNCVDVEMET